MTNLIDLVNMVVSGASFTPGAQTTTANGTGVDLANGTESTNAVLNVGTVTGTTPTLNVKMQESDDNTTFLDIAGATFTQVTATTARQVIRFLRGKRYCRCVATIAGTTPSFAMGLDLFAQKKYGANAADLTAGGISRGPST